jgi:MtrB/PioB family decaheme-associated outer membrane protein
MKTRLAAVAVLWAAPVFAQTPQTVPPAPRVEITGDVTPAVQQFGNDTNSSKLTEYRDVRDGFYLSRLLFAAHDTRTGWQFAFRGANVGRLDQSLFVDAGRPGAWNIRVDWVDVPHNLSNKAMTPYIQRAPGVFGLPATVPITFKKLATAAPDTAGVLASDELIASYQSTFLRPLALGTQTAAGHVGATWMGSDALSVSMSYGRRAKTGSKSTFGPIGDRPPRTLNIQLAEPVDYRTNDLTFAVGHQREGLQIRGEYEFSDFGNRIDTLQWQNPYTTAAPGAASDVWDRLVATSGVRPLPPDNRYHNLNASAGIDLPAAGRLNVSAGYGRLEQNETLLPYAFNAAALTNPTLPRSSAEALISTRNVAVDYAASPIRRLNIRAFFRHYDLNNDTPSSRWQYVTSDTLNVNGTVSYVNKRVSLPFAWNRQNAGAEATWRLPARSSLSLAYEREAIEREFREADTAEHKLRMSWRTRAASWLSMTARYAQGARDGGVYHNSVTQESYWYALSEANDANNPALTFDNHPDMRRFDVSDRARRQFDVTANVRPGGVVALSAYVRYRNDDFDSSVRSSQPLLGTGLPEAQAATPGDQLGRLEDRRVRYGLDAFVQPSERVTLNAFLNYDRGTSLDRSLEFNENNKQNPSAVATAELGPWTRASSQWTADTRDRTWSGGGGATLQIVPERLALVADYTLSLARINIEYAGYGVTNFNGTPFAPNHQFAFSSPPRIVEDLNVLNLRFEVPIRTVTLLVGYSYEDYDLDDWQQASVQPWVESVGVETLLRDTSRSFQWGNRLFNLGTYLAPSYRAHIGFVSFKYAF